MTRRFQLIQGGAGDAATGPLPDLAESLVQAHVRTVAIHPTLPRWLLPYMLGILTGLLGVCVPAIILASLHHAAA
jgi:hypothetical protein